MGPLTITLTLPHALTLARLCKALRLIGMKLTYSGDGTYHLTETH